PLGQGLPQRGDRRAQFWPGINGLATRYGRVSMWAKVPLLLIAALAALAALAWALENVVGSINGTMWAEATVPDAAFLSTFAALLVAISAVLLLVLHFFLQYRYWSLQQAEADREAKTGLVYRLIAAPGDAALQAQVMAAMSNAGHTPESQFALA